jgi:hypothetical protein
MCKKLILVLAIVAMASPAWAIQRQVHNDPPDGPYPGDGVLLKVDIDSFENSGPNETQAGWTAWEMDTYWGPMGAQAKNFGYPGLPIVQIDGVTWSGGAGNLGGSRNRDTNHGGEADNDMANMLGDLVYVGHSTSGMGKDYIKVSMNFGAAMAGTDLQITLWGWDPAFAGSGVDGYGGAGEQAGSKIAAWSTTNPDQWLTDNGYDPNGYGYHATVGESNMPAGLAALVGDSAIMLGRAPYLSMFDDASAMTYASTVEVTLDENGQIVLYGWADMLSETGSQHIALNGFMVSIPEPATIALLGLGGLALIRRKR